MGQEPGGITEEEIYWLEQERICYMETLQNEEIHNERLEELGCAARALGLDHAISYLQDMKKKEEK